MPYTIANSPVKNALPKAANSLWVKTFNSVLRSTGNETTARQSAWSNVKEKYRKVDGKWIKKQMSTPAYIQGPILSRENLRKPRTESERRSRHRKLYGTTKVPPRQGRNRK